MLASVGTAAGGAAGGALGQIGEALSGPRRMLWSALSKVGLLPASGSGQDLLQQTFGMQEGPLRQALGMGAEMALDPLTYLGMAAGGLGGAALEARGTQAGLEAEIASLVGARRAAQEGLVEQAALGADTVASQQARLGGLRSAVDPAALAEAEGKHYLAATPEAIGVAESKGLGTGGSVNDLGTTISSQGDLAQANPMALFDRANPLPEEVMARGVPAAGRDLEFYGGAKPVDFEARHGGAIAGRRGGTQLDLRPETSAAAVPQLSPYERYLLMKEGGAAGSAAQSIHSSADPLADMLAQRGAEINGARVGPTLAEQMLGQGLPQAHIDQIGGMGLGGLSLQEGFGATQSALADALTRQAAHQASWQVSPRELIAAAGLGTGVGAGIGALGMQRR